jgi:outer membrane protein
MNRFFIGWISFLLVVGIQTGALAEGPVKIGVVDVKEFQEKSIAFQKIRNELQSKFQTLQKKLEDEKNALLKLEEDYRKQSMMLSLDAKDDKRNELEKKRRYYKYLYEDLSEQMKDAERDATRRILKELEGVVQKIADDENYTLILERSTPGLVFVDSTLNITDQVTKAYDRQKQQQ